LVERLNGVQEVASSNLAGPTISKPKVLGVALSKRPLTSYRVPMRLQPDLIRGLLLEVEGEEKPDLATWSEEAQL